MSGDPNQTTIPTIIGRAVSSSCCGDCPRGSGNRAAWVALNALAAATPSPAMQRALMGLPADALLTGSQSSEAISRYRALMEAARG